MKSAYFILPLLFALTPSAQAAVDTDKATELVKASIAEALKVLKDPKYQGKEQRVARHAELRRITNEVFDWRTMSQRSLGVHWRSLNDAQRKRFVTTFEELLANNYLGQIDRFTGKERVEYVGTSPSGDSVEVKMKIVTQSQEEVPIHFFLGEALKVYDVSIEGVSIANHYRGSFNRLMVNGNFESLMKRLERKIQVRKKRNKTSKAK